MCYNTSTVREREVQTMRDTDRVRFERKAREVGATVTVSEPKVLKTISVNGQIVTTAWFDDDGKFVDFHTQTFFPLF